MSVARTFPFLKTQSLSPQHALARSLQLTLERIR